MHVWCYNIAPDLKKKKINKFVLMFKEEGNKFYFEVWGSPDIEVKVICARLNLYNVWGKIVGILSFIH